MGKFQALRTDNDFSFLQETCKHFSDARFIRIDYDEEAIGQLLITRLSGNGMPTVELVFSGVSCLHLRNEPIVAVSYEKRRLKRLVRFWHPNSTKHQIGLSSWIVSKMIHWRVLEEE